MADHQVKDMQAYAEGFNKGAELIKTQKKLVSVNASFIKSLMSREYTTSFYQGVSDGWDYGFKQQKAKLQKKQFQKPNNERAAQMEQMQGKRSPKNKDIER